MSASDPNPIPSASALRWSLWYARAAKGLFVVAVGFWLLLGIAWAALHWVVIPRLDGIKAPLESRLSAAMGTKVSIGGLRAYGNGVIPTIEIADVRIQDAQGRETLTLGRVVTAVSPRSALALGFEQLYVEAPELNVRRDIHGKVWVGGIAMGDGKDDDGAAADWLFSQREVVLRGGTLRWTDDMKRQAPLALQKVDIVLRNGFRSHAARLDAESTGEVGSRIGLQALMRQPIWVTREGDWRHWSGKVHAVLERANIAHLAGFAGLPPGSASGVGTMRAWSEVQAGVVTQATFDLSLFNASALLSQGGTDPAAGSLQTTVNATKPLELANFAGRLSLKTHKTGWQDGFEFATQNLQFETLDGLRWPGGNIAFARTRTMPSAHQTSQAQDVFEHSLQADNLDLAALAQIAERLPLQAELRQTLQQSNPSGRVVSLKSAWKATAADGLLPLSLQAKGVVDGIGWKEIPNRMPGAMGLGGEFDFTSRGGKAKLSVRDGSVSLSGWFDEPTIAINRLSTDVTWQISGKPGEEQIAVQLNGLKASNPDASGVEADIKWQTATPPAGNGRGRFPGVLDLTANVAKADASKVHRYLPVAIPKPVREYLRQALPRGEGTQGKFRIKGDLWNFPFAEAKDGEFRISAQFGGVSFAFVPPGFQSPGELPWQELVGVAGEFSLDRLALQVKGATGRIAAVRLPPGSAGASVAPPASSLAGSYAPVIFNKGEARLPDMLNNPTVQVSAEARGGLATMLNAVNASPLRDILGKTLVEASGTGSATLALKLAVPIRTPEKSQVQGQVALQDSDLRVSPSLPAIGRARGAIQFTESGFTIAALQGRMFGGDILLNGGSVPDSAGSLASGGFPPVQIRAQGRMTADALRQSPDIGALARLAQQASGATDYQLTYVTRANGSDLTLQSNLQGMALALPHPLNKPVDQQLPLRFQSTVREIGQANTSPSSPASAPNTRVEEQLQLDVGRLGRAHYVRDVSGSVPRVLRGAISVGVAGEEILSLPASGVSANLNLSQFDLDAWSGVLDRAMDGKVSVADLAPGSARAGNAATQSLAGHLPTLIAIRATDLVVGGRKFNNLVLGGSRDGNVWRANLESAEVDGYMEYRQPQPSSTGRIYARLARVTLAPSAAKEVEALLEEPPTAIPALDVVVEDLQLRGKRLGRLEVEAMNRLIASGPSAQSAEGVREWRLSKLNLAMPEATLTASGNWVALGAQGGRAATGSRNPAGSARRTVLNFKLDIADSGQLLSRLGQPGTIQSGKGRIDGQVSWQGSPLALDYPTLGGAFNVNVESGQFLKADPGIAKLLGVLSLQSLPRRLTLDFRDVFSDGFAFDFIRGDVKIDQGVAFTNNLQMKGVNAAVLMEGRADIAQETQNLRVVVVPEINAGTASLVATAINPVIGLGSFLAQLVLRRPLIEAATQEFQIDGTWTNPNMSRVPKRSAGSEDARASEPKKETQ